MKWCAKCRIRPAARHRSRCGNCSSYYYRHRCAKERPRHLDYEVCTRCRRPLQKGYKRKGLCHTCWCYKRMYGRDRPHRCIDAMAPLGWCDCGQPATQQIDITISERTPDTLLLCDTCSQMETETT